MLRQLISIPPTELHALVFYECIQVLNQQQVAEGVFLSGNAVVFCWLSNDNGWQFQVWEEVY